LELEYSGAPLSDEELAQSAAEAIVAQAQDEAETILAGARAEAERLQEAARERSATETAAARAELAAQRAALAREVRAELETEYRQRYLAAVSALEGAAAELREKQEAYLRQIEQPALELVLAIARQLLGDELSQSPAFIARLIAQAFSLLKPQQVASAAVHPATFERLLADDLFASALAAAGVQPQRVELEIDELLDPDQFVLRVAGVSVEYDLGAGLAEMAAHLRERSASTG
jgi:flagellar biosynthesis/type III secretory pathway protein FliH